MTAEEVELGDRAKDLVSGFSGIVTSRTVYLNGCVRIGITPEAVKKDGTPPDTTYFDDNEVAVIKRRAATWGILKRKIPVHGARGGDPSGR